MRIFTLFAMLWLSTSVLAQVYTYVDENGVRFYTNVKPDPAYGAENLGCFGPCKTTSAAKAVRDTVDWQTTPLRTGDFEAEVRVVAEVFDVDEALVRAVMHAESAFDPQAVSPKGAQGLMQLIPDTARRFGVLNPFDPVDNILGGVAYLAWLLTEFNGDTEHVVAAYNAGEGAVRRHNGIPPYAETREYVRRVNTLYQRYRNGE